jgi:hypothetical protein
VLVEQGDDHAGVCVGKVVVEEGLDGGGVGEDRGRGNSDERVDETDQCTRQAGEFPHVHALMDKARKELFRDYFKGIIGVVGTFLRIQPFVMCVIAAGCVRSSSYVQSVTIKSEEAIQPTIAVYIDGAVNRPGRYVLKRPFTIEQAIIQAGGIDKFEEGQNRSVALIRFDGSKLTVRRKYYKTSVLQNGDALAVPRH